MSTATDLAAEKLTYADALEAAADLIRTLDLPTPDGLFWWEWHSRPLKLDYTFPSEQVEEFAALVRSVPKARPAEKTAEENGTWRVMIEVDGYAVRVTARLVGVCELIEVGTEEYEDTETVETRTVTKTRPVYEQRCPDSLLKMADDVSERPVAAMGAMH